MNIQTGTLRAVLCTCVALCLASVARAESADGAKPDEGSEAAKEAKTLEQLRDDWTHARIETGSAKARVAERQVTLAAAEKDATTAAEIRLKKAAEVHTQQTDADVVSGTLRGLEAVAASTTPPDPKMTGPIDVLRTKQKTVEARLTELKIEQASLVQAEAAATKKVVELTAAVAEASAAAKEAEEIEEDAKKNYEGRVPSSPKLSTELSASRTLRCQVALCWGEGGTQYAVEPVLDLPIGIVWSFGSGALTSYFNANKLNIEFNAGLRLWLWHDQFSIMVYFAQPIINADDKIRVEGSKFEHPASSVHRPYPSIGFGFFGDILQLGFAYDVLVNGDGESDRDPQYRANQVLSQSLTITIAFATVLTARTAFAKGNEEKAEP